MASTSTPPRLAALVAAIGLALTACGGSSDDTASTAPTPDDGTTAVTAPPATDPPATEPAVTDPPATDPPATEPADTEPPADEVDGVDPIEITRVLSGDDFMGRNNLTEGSLLAQDYLVGLLDGLAEPAVGGSYLQPFDEGVNLVAVMPGIGALADEYVIVGAHYDHLGSGPDACYLVVPGENEVCNGTTDNAASVAEVIEIAQRIRARDADETDRRSVVLGLWDAEEDGLLGSKAYVANPVVPLEQTIAYINFDNQGAQMTPGLADWTLAVGAETGGDALVAAADRAVEPSDLTYGQFSLIFGQGRSDHAPFAEAGTPVVFLTDSNYGCYHTALDDFEHLDVDKLESQIDTGDRLVADLLTTEETPQFVGDAPLSTYSDAVQLLEIAKVLEGDLDFLGDDAPMVEGLIADVQAIVDAGPDAYDDDAAGVVLIGAASAVQAFADSECTIPV